MPVHVKPIACKFTWVGAGGYIDRRNMELSHLTLKLVKRSNAANKKGIDTFELCVQ